MCVLSVCVCMCAVDFLMCPPGFSEGMRFVGAEARSEGSGEPMDVLDISRVFFTDIQLDHTQLDHTPSSQRQVSE